jgi:hypothetical protein
MPGSFGMMRRTIDIEVVDSDVAAGMCSAHLASAVQSTRLSVAANLSV